MGDRKKNVVILGSTGSIGISALSVIARYPGRFQVVGLTAYNNLKMLAKQVRQFLPAYVAVNPERIPQLRKEISGRRVKILDAGTDLSEIVALPHVDIVVIGMSGSSALEPFLSAARAGKRIAPANKEALVIAGELIMAEARRCGARIIPVDSEQSAIFQCLEGRNRMELKKVYLTASGGALRNIPRSRFDALKISDILNHPRWKMGKKITVDSATLMNKGFEVIEAQRLFDLNVDDIEVVVHPEAVIHSMVSFKDGSVMAQMGVPDMRLPIQYALTYPQRWDTGLRPLDFLRLKTMTFEKPDVKKFPSLSLALHAARAGGTMPCVLNAADEEAVEAFLKGTLSFSKIYPVVENVVLKHKSRKSPGLADIKAADTWARQETRGLLCPRIN